MSIYSLQYGSVRQDMKEERSIKYLKSQQKYVLQCLVLPFSFYWVALGSMIELKKHYKIYSNYQIVPFFFFFGFLTIV